LEGFEGTIIMYIESTTGHITYDDFSVCSDSTSIVEGLIDGDFTKKLYNPDGTEVSSIIPVIITELGNGNYRSSFTPNIKGTWYLVVYHPTYFPWGKSGNIQVWDSDIDKVQEDIKRLLGLAHENVYIDNTSYDSDGNLENARLRIYSDGASVGTNNNVIATYTMVADTSGPCSFNTWKQVKQ
jgi:hypothetical protein